DHLKFLPILLFQNTEEINHYTPVFTAAGFHFQTKFTLLYLSKRQESQPRLCRLLKRYGTIWRLKNDTFTARYCLISYRQNGVTITMFQFPAVTDRAPGITAEKFQIQVSGHFAVPCLSKTTPAGKRLQRNLPPAQSVRHQVFPWTRTG